MLLMRTYKENIRKDLKAKGADYFENNYLKDTRQNYLRRLRRNNIIECLGNVQDGSRVLDMGCGPAILFPELLRTAEEYVAVDLVDANLEEIKKKNKNKKLNLIEEDMDNFSWQEDYFDVIICLGVIEYSEDPEGNLLRLITYLKKGGMLICSFPNMSSPYRIWGENIYLYIWKLINSIFGKRFYYYPRKLFSGKKVTKLILKRLDPESMAVNYFGHKFFIQPFDLLLGWIDHKLTVFFNQHPLRLFRPFCVEFILRVKK